jgi:hypothetical protein
MKMGQEHSSTRSASRKPSTPDLHWVAGFIEGEGTFYKNNTNSQGIKVSQVQKQPLEKLLSLLGGSLRKHKASTRPSRVSQGSYYWYVGGARARGIMLTLYSLMSPKRKLQIQRALS